MADLYRRKVVNDAVASSYGSPLGPAMFDISVKLLIGNSGKSDGLRTLSFFFTTYNTTDKKSLK